MVLANQGGAGTVILLIPYNQDGSVRNETRLLSIGVKGSSSSTLNKNGDTFSGNITVTPNTDAGFLGNDGNSLIALSVDRIHLFKLTYNEALGGTCTGYQSYNPYTNNNGYPNASNAGGPPADDCFQWTNLTSASASPAMDIRSQIVRGYQTGLVNGVAVGPAHPGFDLGWLANPQSSTSGGGYFPVVMQPAHTSVGITDGNPWREHLGVYAAFDSTGVLKMVKNMWGGDLDSDFCCGGVHAVGIQGGSWRFGAMSNLQTLGNDGVFLNSFDMPTTQVNRAGYGSAPSWDTNSGIGASEKYTCPPDNLMPVRYQLATMQALGYSGAALGGSTNCIQIKVSTPPCNANPDPVYTFVSGNKEKVEFPCTTPGFGNANVNRSKLRNLQVGDWLWEQSAGTATEKLVVLKITYNGTNDIDIWLLRWAAHNYLIPLFAYIDDDCCTHAPSNAWTLATAPSFVSTNGASIAIDLSAGSSAVWLPDNPMRADCHGTIGPGLSAGLYNVGTACYGGAYRGSYNKSIPSILFAPFDFLAASYPSFATSANGASSAYTQSYNSNTYNAGTANPAFQLDWRTLNPASGTNPENLTATTGGARTLTAVGGATTKSYLITDPLSAGSFDYKRLLFYGWAGRYLLKDVSNTGTSNTADLADYSACHAFVNGQCFSISTAGQNFVSVPRAFVDANCRTNQYTLHLPV